MNSRLAILGLACIGLAACGGSTHSSVTPRATATPSPSSSLAPSASVAPSSSASGGGLTTGTLITLTGAEAMSISGFSADSTDISTYATCYAGVYSGFDVFMISDVVGSGSQGAGDIVTVQLLTHPGGFGPIYDGPESYTINYTGSASSTSSPITDGVSIYPPFGAADPNEIAQLWDGTITVASGGTSATFEGTYGQLTASGAYSSDGQMSGTITCPPGAPS